MTMTTRGGEKIAFTHNTSRTIMTVTGAAEERTRHEEVELDLTVDDLMDLQNEVYIAIHGRPDPVVSKQREADDRLKRLVKEAVSELLSEGISSQSGTPVTNVFNQTNIPPMSDFFADLIGSWLTGGKPGPKS